MKAKLVQIPPKTIDDFGDVVKRREAFAPTERLYQKMRSELAALAAEADPAAELLCTGERWKLRISACSIERTVDVGKAKKKLGAVRFLQTCTVTLKALGNFLAKPEVDALTVCTQTGSRSYNPIPISSVSE